LNSDKEIFDEAGRPVLLAVRDSRGYLKVWCKYCKRWHYHGKYEGHLLAHCLAKSGSPYRKSGYVLKTAD